MRNVKDILNPTEKEKEQYVLCPQCGGHNFINCGRVWIDDCNIFIFKDDGLQWDYIESKVHYDSAEYLYFECKECEAEYDFKAKGGQWCIEEIKENFTLRETKKDDEIKRLKRQKEKLIKDVLGLQEELKTVRELHMETTENEISKYLNKINLTGGKNAKD